MPYNYSYVIGDKINHIKLGAGIIVGRKMPKSNNSIAIFHVYYYGKNIFLYNVRASFTKISDATDETREEARHILLTKLIETPTDAKPRKYHIGDIISYYDQQHQKHEITILDNGRLCDKEIRYHICTLQGNEYTFLYTTLTDNYTIKYATKPKQSQTKKFVLENFLWPAYQ